MCVELIQAHTEPPTFGFLGRARVNVLELNLALDETLGARRQPAVRPVRQERLTCQNAHARFRSGIRASSGRRSLDSFRKLDPRIQIKNPVMFIVEVGSLLTTIIFIQELAAGTGPAALHRAGRLLAVVHGAVRQLRRGDGRRPRQGAGRHAPEDADRNRGEPADDRRSRGDRCRRRASARATWSWCSAGEFIPGDGEIIEGVASVDESAITGESAPVIRESGGDRSAVTGGTRVISDWIKVRVTSDPGHTFLDRMIALVEGAERQKTPNEIALNILLAVLTLVFLLVVVTLQPFAYYAGTEIPIPVLIALLVCLIPTTIGALISAIGIAGMDRLVQHNVLAMSGRAVEAAGDVHTLLLDKTGTITLGNRQATEFVPVSGVTEGELADAAQLASLADETPEGRSIVVLAKEKYRIRGRELADKEAVFVPFTAQTRMSGINLDGREIRKGAADAIAAYVKSNGGVGVRRSCRPSSIASRAPAARRSSSPSGRARSASST